MKLHPLVAGCLVVVFALACSSLGGCASGPKYSEVCAQIPPVPAGKGRVYFFRDSAFGAGLKPHIKANDIELPKSQANSFFFEDFAPANYTIRCKTEAEESVSFYLEAGQTKYVRTRVGMGFWVGRVVPELVEETEAKKALPDLAYIGVNWAPPPPTGSTAPPATN